MPRYHSQPTRTAGCLRHARRATRESAIKTEQRASHLPGRKDFGTRIKDRQPGRPKELAEIDGVGDQGVRDAGRNGALLERQDVVAWLENGRHGAGRARLSNTRGIFSTDQLRDAVAQPMASLPSLSSFSDRRPASALSPLAPAAVAAASSPATAVRRATSPASAWPIIPRRTARQPPGSGRAEWAAGVDDIRGDGRNEK